MSTNAVFTITSLGQFNNSISAVKANLPPVSIVSNPKKPADPSPGLENDRPVTKNDDQKQLVPREKTYPLFLNWLDEGSCSVTNIAVVNTQTKTNIVLGGANVGFSVGTNSLPGFPPGYEFYGFPGPWAIRINARYEFVNNTHVIYSIVLNLEDGRIEWFQDGDGSRCAFYKEEGEHVSASYSSRLQKMLPWLGYFETANNASDFVRCVIQKDALTSIPRLLMNEKSKNVIELISTGTLPRADYSFEASDYLIPSFSGDCEFGENTWSFFPITGWIRSDGSPISLIVTNDRPARFFRVKAD